MNLSGPFIKRPVATMLLSLAIMLLGGVSFGLLPVSPLPQMDFPVIVVQASLPGASPEVMASTVATPLERSFGAIRRQHHEQPFQSGLDPGHSAI